jgi:cytochrome oxidase Cu insertion factor (SCO1/SenC/PrrC family)
VRTDVLTVAVLGFVAVLGTSCGNGGEERSAGRREPLKVGAEAPPFTLPSPDDESVSLEDYRGRRPVLLYFSMGPG